MSQETNNRNSPEQLLYIMGHQVYDQSLEAATLALETSDPEKALGLMLLGLESA